MHVRNQRPVMFPAELLSKYMDLKLSKAAWMDVAWTLNGMILGDRADPRAQQQFDEAITRVLETRKGAAHK